MLTLDRHPRCCWRRFGNYRGWQRYLLIYNDINIVNDQWRSVFSLWRKDEHAALPLFDAGESTGNNSEVNENEL